MAVLNLAYLAGCIDIHMLRLFVITEQNRYGRITKEEFKKITGKEFDDLSK